HELSRAQQQANLLKALVEIPQTTTTVDERLASVAKAFGESFTANQCVLQTVENGQLQPQQGLFQLAGMDGTPVETDPLIQDAIATQKIQLFLHTSTSPHNDYYADKNIGIHLVIPLLYKEDTSAILALQWKKGFTLEKEDVSTLHLVSHQLALSLACMG
ncbi:MAG: GAF domain-containing protein, partial [Okeania sp. SIO2H7]|nr:GAF domain-containing protein [Okeania sp. SIO2H7]